MAKKLWAGRFSRGTRAEVEAFTESVSFDRKLYRYDIQGSIAHCRMLARQNIIAARDARRIIRALQDIEREIADGRLAPGPADEDIHMLIESRLIQKVGPAGGVLHTARSRNDQIALDITLYLRDAVAQCISDLDLMRRALLQVAERHIGAVMPGFTHLQHAQPVLFSHHLLAYVAMFGRDRSRLEDCLRRLNCLPLGAGALAGTPHPIDRRYTARLLGFPAVSANSMDTVSDRDALIEFCACAAVIMMHLSRLCEELILWSSPEFQFIELPDEFCTGSSIMPQKKNPDVAELIRGKTGRVYGDLMALLTIMKGLPLTYNRDLQEDKPPLFDAVETVTACLRLCAAMLPAIQVREDRMSEACRAGFLTATDLADYLVRQGVPFRSAHEVVGKIVAHCVRSGKNLEDLSLHELQRFSPKIKADAARLLTIEASVNSRTSAGGTALSEVKKALARAKADIKNQEKKFKVQCSKFKKNKKP